MQVILLDEVEKLGKLGDVVNVKPGYARNFLFPKEKALLATKENIAVLESQRVERQAKLESVLVAAREKAEKISSIESLPISSKAGSEGKLFGSVGAADIASAMKAMGLDIEKSAVRLTEGPLRTLGEHEVNIHLHREVNCKLIVNIIPM